MTFEKSATEAAGLAKPAAVTQTENGFSTIWATLAVSLFIVLFDNNQFWSLVGRSIIPTENPVIVATVLFLLLFGAVNVSLALSLGVRGFKATAGILLLVASATGFYMSEFGIVVDPSIIRSVAETDAREAATLLSGELYLHVLLFGVLPALAVLIVPLKRQRLSSDIGLKLALIFVSVLTPATVIYADYLEFSIYAQQNRQVRLFMNPVYPLYATGQYVSELLASPVAPADVQRNDVVRLAQADTSKPLAVVLVLGETARADHWSMNGYDRDTNRYTARHDVVNFPNVVACGTSTADSLPCIFSPLTRNEFDHLEAARHETLLALMKRLSMGVLWIDNSTGCKGICDEDDFVSVASDDDPSLCDEYGCYDGLLLRELERVMSTTENDIFVVLHERGSHGPTYHQNVPIDAKAYSPECTLDTFRECDNQALTNAYDNTILYSDRVLGDTIEYLKSLEPRFDTILLYVSDHGESLGENGIYLHGFPYILAPSAQTQVPMLFWASESYYENTGVDRACFEQESSEPHSHDEIFHTAIGLVGAQGKDYRPDLDLLANCRRTQYPHSTIALDDRQLVSTRIEVK